VKGKLILLLGLGATAGAGIWWYSFYSGVARFVGGGGGGPPIGCLYAMSGPCRMVSQVAALAGANAYQPLLFWVGVGLIIVGLVLQMMEEQRSF